MTTYVNLLVNDVPIDTDYFVEEFIHRVVNGIILSLRGTAEIDTLELSIDEKGVNINLNNTVVPANPFVNKIIKSTIYGMVSSLKGVDRINTLKLTIKR